ncbi:UDP-N-acetylglucosamine transferase subunit ALG14 isoform X2 [Hydra vulgaris]|uniref:UDP-N-acetylglucosamine transferase subunit ALG14 n=1 Tax=Hydra vulgaris TaxID=6087 RepID=A0ABM4D595_HYDVU
MLFELCAIILGLFVLFICRVKFLLLKLSKRNVNVAKQSCRIMIIIGSGGHTAEMMRLVNSLSNKYYPRVYVLAESDKQSLNKITEYEQIKFNKEPNFERIYRSREVNQSWFLTLFTSLFGCFQAFFILLKHKPDLVLCNGPGTCVPLCFVAFLLKVVFLSNTKIVFVESICRVKSLSLTAKILYLFADRLLVQWSDLLLKYPRAVYIGKLV